MNDFILHIDTSSSNGIVMLSRMGRPEVFRENPVAKDHAAFVQPAVKEVLTEAGVTPDDILCVAVANGPGSYTGIRVGLASAKGLCYAWNKPLLTVSSLYIMAKALQLAEYESGNGLGPDLYFAPMIDARRMEVFFALYRYPLLETIIEPCARVVEESFLEEELKGNTIVFGGDGAQKWQSICVSSHAVFREVPSTKSAFSHLSFYLAEHKKWANLAYSEPFYAKEFYTPSGKL